MLISVVVSTHNRANLLANVLQTLSEQTLSSSEYEVIVVDNNSTDGTRGVTEEFAALIHNLRYCFETNVGLSYARNRGWREAYGSYVAYIDDDCEAPPHWLSIAKEIIEKISPAVFGGPYFALYNTSKPDWFKDAYGSRDHGNEARALLQSEYLSGGNIFFRRKILENFGDFDVTMGMAGTKIAYGEEAALQNKIRAAMPHELIYYEPQLYVKHLVRPEKMKMRWLIPAFFARGRYVYLANLGHEAASLRRQKLIMQIIKTFFALVADISIATVKRDRRRYAYIQNYFYECSSKYLRSLGRLCTQYQQISQCTKLNE